jgi:predicted Zn finger-like uncharacterized protein
MSATTLCPTCHTRFRVSREQLEAHQGLVRCGRCQAVFNAAEYLQEEVPSPQLDLPITERVDEPVDAAMPDAPAPHQPLAHEPAPQEPALREPTPQEPVVQEPMPSEPAPEPAPVISTTQESHADATSWQPVVVRTDEVMPHIQVVHEIATDEPVTPILDLAHEKPAKKTPAWLWMLANLVMLSVLLAQAAYFFRVDLAAIEPRLKPALESWCGLLNCTVPLPQNADLMGIESSELEADPAQSSVIALSALLRNHAPYVQAFPNLELTLTDTEDKPLARRSFRPAQYLKPGDNEKQGLAANRELGVKLTLDTTDLKPSGYRLFLYYPH